MKKIFALFTLAAACCLAGCSNVTNIYETDERLHAQTETGLEEQFTTLDARAAVYNGEYERFEMPEGLNIEDIIAPIGENRFVVYKNDLRIFDDDSWEDKSEYGIYTLGGEYKMLFPKYSTVDSQNMRSSVLFCNEEYILYEKSVLNQYGSIAATEFVDVYLLDLDSMTEKRIYRFLQPYASNAVICDDIVYLERTGEKIDSASVVYKGTFSSSSIVKYDIEKGELEDFCLNAGAPTIYKDKLGFYVGDGNFVSRAEPLFVPEEYGLATQTLKIFPTDEMAYSYYESSNGDDYTIMGYIKDGKPFNIFKTDDLVGVYNVDFADGCAVWNCGFSDMDMFPMFYCDEKKSVIVIEDERGLYKSHVHDGKIYFFKRSSDYSEYEYVLVLDTENIK